MQNRIETDEQWQSAGSATGAAGVIDRIRADGPASPTAIPAQHPPLDETRAAPDSDSPLAARGSTGTPG